MTIVILVLLPTIATAHRRDRGGSDRFSRHARQHRPGTRQGGPLRGRHGRRRDPTRPAAADARLERGLEGAVHAGGPRHRDRVRLPVVDRVRRLVRARGVPRRRGGRRIRHEPPGRGRRPATPRRVRRPLLRVGRDAVRSRHPDRDAAGHRGRGLPRGLRQGDRQVRDRRAVRLPGPGRLDGRRRVSPDRRVLVHRGHRRPVARAPPARGVPAHRRRGAAVDRAQPGALPFRRSARGAAAHEFADDPPARLAGRRPRAPGADRRRRAVAAARHPVRLRPGRTAGRRGRSTGAASPTS